MTGQRRWFNRNCAKDQILTILPNGKLEPVLEIEKYNILWNFEIQTDPLIPIIRPDLVLNNRKKNWHPMKFAAPADHRVRMKINKNIYKYLERNKKAPKTVECGRNSDTIVVGALWMVTKGLGRKLEIRGRIETVQITVLRRLAIIRRIFLETRETCCQSDFSERPAVLTGVKNS